MVAETVAERFKQFHTQAQEKGATKVASVPSFQIIEELIDVSFWASLRREEGYSPKISLAFLAPGEAAQALLFRKPLSFTPGVLTKLAPGVERAGIHLGVWPEGDKLCIWGITRVIPALCFVLDVSEPGLLVVKYRRLQLEGKFANVAVLKGDQVRIVEEHHLNLPDCPELITSLISFTSASSSKGSVNVLVQLAVSMRAHKRGGTLLVVPAKSDHWRKSIVHPVTYVVEPSFSGLTELLQQEVQQRKNRWQGDLVRAVDGLAGFTAIDGATIINDQYELLAFGAKIGRPEGSVPVEQMILTEPVAGNIATVVHPAQHGGTRHLSAAQFVHDQRDALALVASQDGHFTIFSWSPCEGMVHAYRVDALLL